MKKFYLLFSILLYFNTQTVFSQIAAEGFENSTYFSLSSTGTLSNYISGASGAGDSPSGSAFAAVGTYAYGVNNGTTTLISETYDTRCYTAVTLSLRLASFSYGATTNGAEVSDNVVVSISTDGGATFTSILTVTGAAASNARWDYTATGIATTAYPTTASFAPAGTGVRTADGYSTLRITSLPNTATLVVKIVAINNSANELWTIDDFKITGTANTGASAPTTPTGITFTQVGCNAFLVSWTNGSGNANLVAVKAGSAVTGSPTNGTGYTLTNTNGALFGIGSTLNAGEYVVYNSSGNSVLIYGLNAATTYYVSIWESNCFKYNATPLTGNVTTTVCTYCPQMNSVLVDGCNTTCGVGNEGQTELAFFNSGSYSIPVNVNAVGYNFSQTTNPPTTSFADNIVAMPSTISTMNSAAGCGTLFVDAATAGYIPPYSTFVIATSAFCSLDYNTAGLCALAPIYMIFTTSNNWNTSGNYTNHNCPSPNNKYFYTDFSEAGISCAHYYYYDACLVASGDGAYISYANSQTTNTTSANTLAPSVYSASGSCTLPIVLPVNLLSFTASKINENISVNWATETETNNDYFLVEYSLDGTNFTQFNETKGAGNSFEKRTYKCGFNKDIGNKTPYFRLKQVDFDGKHKYSQIISLEEKYSTTSNLSAFYNTVKDKIITQFNLEFPQEVSIGLYDITGSKLSESIQLYNEGNNEFLLTAPDKMGIYILVYQNGNSTPVRKKIIISK